MLKGRLGLETARIPHADRFGLLWLDCGALTVEHGCLRFQSGGGDVLEAGDHQVPHQSISMILLGPGSTVSHDALRLLARHGTALVAVGRDGVRTYTAPPLMPDDSALARAQVRSWSDEEGSRLDIARRMYAWRFGRVLPHRDIAVLRGIEGGRVKQIYRETAKLYGIKWNGRRYDRQNPSAADLPNQALNHAATITQSAATIAVMATSTIPQLGFVHEDSSQSFVLDVADLFRDTFTVPIAFEAAAMVEKHPGRTVDRTVRRLAGARMRRDRLISRMIERIQALFEDEEVAGGGKRQ